MKLPLLLADEAACPGSWRPIVDEPRAICYACARRVAYQSRHGAGTNVAPAAEWSDTRNDWQCANRLPMEG